MMNLTIQTPDMTEAALEFWFKDHEHIRSPFPAYIRESLRDSSVSAFERWCQSIKPDAAKDINEEILAEKFEEILFEIALGMVATEDEKLTVRYPFMPRIGDVIRVQGVPDASSESKVTDRWQFKKGDEAFLKVKMLNLETGESWETEFELPE